MKSPREIKRAAMAREESEAFRCAVCGREVAPQGAGTRHRNHCPHCLSSLHLDYAPGDRAARCGGIMDAVGVWVRQDGEWALLHRCRVCGAFHSNRVAADDNPALLLQLAAKPLAAPPFPLSRLRELIENETPTNAEKEQKP